MFKWLKSEEVAQSDTHSSFWEKYDKEHEHLLTTPGYGPWEIRDECTSCGFTTHGDSDLRICQKCGELSPFEEVVGRMEWDGERMHYLNTTGWRDLIGSRWVKKEK